MQCELWTGWAVGFMSFYFGCVIGSILVRPQRDEWRLPGFSLHGSYNYPPNQVSAATSGCVWLGEDKVLGAHTLLLSIPWTESWSCLNTIREDIYVRQDNLCMWRQILLLRYFISFSLHASRIADISFLVFLGWKDLCDNNAGRGYTFMGFSGMLFICQGLTMWLWMFWNLLYNSETLNLQRPSHLPLSPNCRDERHVAHA